MCVGVRLKELLAFRISYLLIDLAGKSVDRTNAKGKKKRESQFMGSPPSETQDISSCYNERMEWLCLCLDRVVCTDSFLHEMLLAECDTGIHTSLDVISPCHA